jgi:hypothetical protein
MSGHHIDRDRCCRCGERGEAVFGCDGDRVYRGGVGTGVFGVGDMLGIDGMDGIFIFFMSFIMEAQQSSFAACMEPQQPECAKKRRYTPATMMKMPTAMPVIARAG